MWGIAVHLQATTTLTAVINEELCASSQQDNSVTKMPRGEETRGYACVDSGG
jgi:hypothetical protein